MPIVKREVLSPEEYFSSNETMLQLCQKSPPADMLKNTAFANMTGVLHQLGYLASYSTEMFNGLYQIAKTTNKRISKAQARFDDIYSQLPRVEQQVYGATDSTVFYENDIGKFMRNDQPTQELFTPRTRDTTVLTSYNECMPPPDLRSLDEYTPGDGSCLDKYSNPSFFFDEWLEAETRRQQKLKQERAEARKRRGKGGKKSGDKKSRRKELKQLDAWHLRYQNQSTDRSAAGQGGEMRPTADVRMERMDPALAQRTAQQQQQQQQRPASTMASSRPSAQMSDHAAAQSLQEQRRHTEQAVPSMAAGGAPRAGLPVMSPVSEESKGPAFGGAAGAPPPLPARGGGPATPQAGGGAPPPLPSRGAAPPAPVVPAAPAIPGGGGGGGGGAPPPLPQRSQPPTPQQAAPPPLPSRGGDAGGAPPPLPQRAPAAPVPAPQADAAPPPLPSRGQAGGAPPPLPTRGAAAEPPALQPPAIAQPPPIAQPPAITSAPAPPPIMAPPPPIAAPPAPTGGLPPPPVMPTAGGGGGGGGGGDGMGKNLLSAITGFNVGGLKKAVVKKEPDARSGLLDAIRGGGTKLRSAKDRAPSRDRAPPPQPKAAAGVAEVLMRRIAIAGSESEDDDDDDDDSDDGWSD